MVLIGTISLSLLTSNEHTSGLLQSDVYVKMPLEDFEEGMYGKLNRSMYGIQDAAFNWEVDHREFMLKCGFV